MNDVYFSSGKSSLGLVLISVKNESICGIFMDDHSKSLEAVLQERFKPSNMIRKDSKLKEITHEIINFIEKPEMEKIPSLEPTI